MKSTMSSSYSFASSSRTYLIVMDLNPGLLLCMLFLFYMGSSIFTLLDFFIELAVILLKWLRRPRLTFSSLFSSLVALAIDLVTYFYVYLSSSSTERELSFILTLLLNLDKSSTGGLNDLVDFLAIFFCLIISSSSSEILSRNSALAGNYSLSSLSMTFSFWPG